MSVTLGALHRHPVKGLSPEEIGEAMLEEGGFFPHDRLFALENGPSGYNPAAHEHLPKQKFLMLMRDERLARLKTQFDPAARLLTIRQGGGIVAQGSVDTAEGRGAIERFLESYLGEQLRGPVKLLSAPPNARFMDSRSGYVSILNLASIAAIAALVNRQSLDARRFRGNLHISGWEPWAENFLVGARLAIGEAELEVIKRIDRCAAVDVDPNAGLRDLRLVQTLEQHLRHHDCGVYARILKSGLIRRGDEVRVR
jgi:uncharacterized protein